jgi:hypothetical protein
LALAAPADAEGWRIYNNERFGTTAEVPADWRAGRPPENGDGLVFTSPDGRREALTSLLRGCEHGIRLSEYLDGADGETVSKHACKLGLEGIVAKRRDRPYRSGRSIDWVKVKNPNAPAATRLLEEELPS